MIFRSNTQTTVISPHTRSYENPIKISQGETVTIEKDDPEWPGWLWCSTTTGLSGWVPEDILEKTGQGTKALEDYDATELSIVVGEQLKLIKEKNGWVWSEAQTGECGWVPNKCVGFISRLTKNQHTINSLQKLLEANTPAYLAMTGLPARDNEAAELFDECPPNINPDEKIIMGLMVGDDLKGVVDLAPGYPDQSTVFLGLLLISQELQGLQFGKKLYSAAEQEIMNGGTFHKIRLAVSETNKAVLTFWEKMGFVATGERKKILDDRFEAYALMMEKII